MDTQTPYTSTQYSAPQVAQSTQTASQPVQQNAQPQQSVSQGTDSNVPQGLDPTAFYLTKAIKKTETGGSSDQYTAIGKSGEYGAYQYTPDTWSTDSQKYLGQNIPLDQATPEQQNEVAYKSIENELKDHTQSEVASWWNSGKYDPNLTGKGTNKYGAQYDVPGYVNKVKQNYLSYSQGNNAGGVTPGPENAEGQITSVNVPTPPTTGTGASAQPGLLQSLIQGIASPVTKGLSTAGALYDTATGNQQGAQNIENNGLNYGYFGTQKPIGAGFDVTKGPIANAGPLADAVGTGAQAAGDIGLGSGLLKGVSGVTGLFGGGTALESDGLDSALSKAFTPQVYSQIGDIEDMPAAQQVTTLESALQNGANNLNTVEKDTINTAIQEARAQGQIDAGIGTSAQLHPNVSTAKNVVGKVLKTAAYGGGLLFANDEISKLASVLKNLIP